MRLNAKAQLTVRTIGKALGLILTIVGFTACVLPNDPNNSDDKQPSDTKPIVGSADSSHDIDPAASPVCTVDSYKQSEQGDYIKKVDVLFVMDHSGSMVANWQKVAANIRELVRQVPSDVSIRYAIILGDVGTWRGQLYSSTKTKVLDSEKMTVDQIGSALYDSFSKAMQIIDEGSGEALFYSLYYATTKYLKQNQEAGFFRADAALSVVFMSDEQEIGFPFPAVQAGGIPNRCDTDFENRIKSDYYGLMNINLDTTYAAVKAVKGDMPFAASAIINLNADDVFKNNSNTAKCIYESPGYGYFEMVQKTGGALYSIKADLAAALATVGANIRKSIQLTQDFKLSKPANEINASTIQVKVDNLSVAHKYDPNTVTVHLDYAGKAGSSIDIAYCGPVPPVDPPNPIPDPSPTPIPDPTPVPQQWQVVGFDGTTTPTTASIIWQTQGVPTKAVLNIGLTADNLSLLHVNVSEMNAVQFVTVENLAPGTIYYFQVVCVDANGKQVTSNIISKKTKE